MWGLFLSNQGVSSLLTHLICSLFPEENFLRGGIGGGILGDDMGMGKTVQISSFLGSMLYSERIDFALIVLPTSLVPQWEGEVLP